MFDSTVDNNNNNNKEKTINPKLLDYCTSDNTGPLYSLTFNLANVIASLNEKRAPNESKKITCVICEVIALTGIFVLGSIEFLARSIYSLVLKTIHFFIPKSRADWFEKNFYLPSVKASVLTGYTLVTIASSPFLTCMNEEKEEKSADAIYDSFKSSIKCSERFVYSHIW